MEAWSYSCLHKPDHAGDVRIDVLQGAGDKNLDPDECNPVQLGIFSHR